MFVVYLIMSKWANIIIIMITIPIVAFPVAHYLGFLTDIDLEPVTKLRDNEHNIEKILIKNNGILQAKDVDIFIKKNNMTLRNNFCLEGTIHDNIDNDDYLKIHFPKLSIGFECSLTFIGENNTGIGYALISEQDRNVDQWYISKDSVESKIFLNNILVYIFTGYAFLLLYVAWLLVTTPKKLKKIEPTSKFRKYMIEKYGRILNNIDEKLIHEINNGKNTNDSLSQSLNINKYYVKRRINFLHKKKIISSKQPITISQDISQNIN